MNGRPFARLRTKLHQPRLSPHLISQPVEYLNQNPQRPLTMISASVSFDKVTLVVEWLPIRFQPVAWLFIGHKLIISPRTVKKHTFPIYQKPGVTKRREAVVKAAEIEP